MSSETKDFRSQIMRVFTFLGGIYFFFYFVCPESTVEAIGLKEAHEPISNGFIVVGAMAIGLGLLNILGKHGAQVAFKRKGWPYSAALLLGLSSMLVVTCGQWLQGLRISKEIQAVQVIGDFATRIVDDAQALVESRPAAVKSVSRDGTLPALGVRVDALKHYSEMQLAAIEEGIPMLRKQAPIPALVSELEQNVVDLKTPIALLSGVSREVITPADSATLKDFSFRAAKLASSYALVLRKQSAGTLVQRLYDLLYSGLFIQLGSAMFALLGVYIAAAAYRAFRIKTFESALMMTAALIVMLGQIAFGKHLYEGMPGLRQWLLEVPSSAAFRAIRLGAAVAGLMLAIRMWLSIESSSFSSKKRS